MYELPAACGPDDAVLLKCWPRICQERGWFSPEERGRAARVRFLETIPARRAFCVKGPRATAGQWFSAWRAWKFWKSEVTTKVFGMAHLARQEKWAPDWESLFNVALPHEVVDTSSAAASSTEPASASVGASEPAVDSKAKARERAKQQYHALIKRSHNAIHAVLRLLINPDTSGYVNMITTFYNPLYDEHNAAAQGVKSPAQVMQFYRDMAKDQWLEPLIQMVKK